MKLLPGIKAAVVARAVNRETMRKGSHISVSPVTDWGIQGKQNSGKPRRTVDNLRIIEWFGLEGTSKTI